jgi:hypothetical protein
MGRWIDEWMDDWMGEWMDGWMDEWIDRSMDGWVGGWIEGYMDELMVANAVYPTCQLLLLGFFFPQKFFLPAAGQWRAQWPVPGTVRRAADSSTARE